MKLISRLTAHLSGSLLFLPIRIVLYLGLTVFGLRDYIFGSGYILYQNWSWPTGSVMPGIVPGVYNPGGWSFAGADALGFTRAYAMWPVWLGHSASIGSSRTEFLVLVYISVVGYVVASIAASLFVRYIGLTRSSYGYFSIQLFFVTLFTLNPAAIQWQAGLLFSFYWGSPLICITVLAWLLSFRSKQIQMAIVAGVSLGILSTLDPRLFLWTLFPLLGGTLLRLAFHTSRIHTLRRTSVALIMALPGLALTLAGFGWASGAGLALRESTAQSIVSFSSNTGWSQGIDLLGPWWSSLTYAPPVAGVLGTSVSSLPVVGSPPYLLLPPGLVTGIWLLCLGILPALAFSCLMVKSLQRIALPFALLASAGIALALIGQLPDKILSTMLSIGSGTPIIGSVFQNTVAIPYLVQTLSEAAFVPLICISLYSLALWLRKIRAAGGTSHSLSVGTARLSVELRRTRIRHTGRVLQACILGILVAAILLPSWQGLNGSFAPSGWTPGWIGNQVSATGSYSPEHIPVGDQHVFQFLSQMKSTGRVYWPGPGGSFYSWSNRSTPSLSTALDVAQGYPTGLSNLLASNLTPDTSRLLAVDGIRWVVVDNLTTSIMESAFGVPSETRVVDFFNQSPGIHLVMSFPDQTWLFENNFSTSAWGLHTLPIIPPSPALELGPALAGLDEVGFPASVVPQGFPIAPSSLAVDNFSASLAPSTAWVQTPTGLLPQLLTPRVHGLQTSQANTSQIAVGSGSTITLPPPEQNWTITSWSLPNGSANATLIQNGSLVLQHSGKTATFSVNYGLPLLNGQEGVLHVSPQQATVVVASFKYDLRKASAGTSVSANLVASNSSLSNVFQFNSQQFSSVSGWTYANLTAVIPKGASYFTLRLFVSLSGSLGVSNISLGWAQSLSSPNTFSGALIGVQHSSIKLPVGPTNTTDTLALSVSGLGNVSIQDSRGARNFTIDTPCCTWLTTAIRFSGSAQLLSFDGNVSVGGLLLVPESYSQVNLEDSVIANTTSSSDFSLSGFAPKNSFFVTDEAYSPHWSVNSQVASDSSSDLVVILRGGYFNVTGRIDGSSYLVFGSLSFGGYVLAVVVWLAYPHIVRRRRASRPRPQLRRRRRVWGRHSKLR